MHGESNIKLGFFCSSFHIAGICTVFRIGVNIKLT
jgi:hypothetical protein